jgi:hypothetical protein
MEGLIDGEMVEWVFGWKMSVWVEAWGEWGDRWMVVKLTNR